MAGPVPGRGPGDEPGGPGPLRSRPHRRGPEGDVAVSGSDEQSEHDVDLPRWIALAHRALEAEGVEGEAELALLFVDEDTMAGLNQEFMGSSGPTDVLAFPIDEIGPTGRWPDAGPTGPHRDDEELDDMPLLLGDVVVCPAVAVRQAPEHDCPVDDEIALLVVHGVLHVLGHDHAEPDETARMKAREQDILGRYHHGTG